MKINPLLILAICLNGFFSLSVAQDIHAMDYYIQDSDTVRCVALVFAAQNKPQSFVCIDESGAMKEVHDPIKNNIRSFKQNSKVYDLIQTKAGKKPKQAFCWRKIEGAIMVYEADYNHPMIPFMQNDPAQKTDFYYISINGAEILKLDLKQKDMEEHLLPLLTDCEGYRNNYKGEFEPEYLDYIIRIYNQYCNQ